jgi:hypothetical protein
MLRLKYKSAMPWKLCHVVGPQWDVTVRKSLHISWMTCKMKKRMKFEAWKRFPSVIYSICQYKLTMVFNVIQGTFDRLSDHDSCRKENDDYDMMPGMKPCCGCHSESSYGTHQGCFEKPQRGHHRGRVLHRDNASVIITLKPVWIIIIMAFLALLLLGTQTSAMDAENGKGIMGKLPVFTGRKDAFVMWMAKFMAVAMMGYYIEAVSYDENTKVWGEPGCPKTMAEAAALNSGVPAEKLRIEMWKRNSKAFAALTLCMPDKHVRFIAGAKGMAGEVMKSLFREYRSQDNISHVEAEHLYKGIHLTNNGNPRYLEQRFAEIAALHPIPPVEDSKLIAVVLQFAPVMYSSVLTTERSRISKGVRVSCGKKSTVDETVAKVFRYK